MKLIRTLKVFAVAALLSLIALPAQALAANGFVVCIDPGHGTYYYDSAGNLVSDGGTAKNGVTEAPTNMAIALACKAELEANGYTVVLTHETTYYYQGEIGYYYNSYTGTTLSDSSAGYNWANWKKAINTAVNAGADFFFEVHCNAAGNVTAQGAEAYYQYATSGTKTTTYNLQTCSAVSYRAANGILTHLISEVGLVNRGTKVTTRSNVKYPDGAYTDGYSWLLLAREQNLPAVLCEHAFVTNESDAKILLERADDIGVADAHGIMEALEADGKWTTNSTGRAFVKPNGSQARNEWVSILGFYYYFDDNGNPVTGTRTIDGVTYYFNEKGKAYASGGSTTPSVKTGWQYENGKYYYYSASGTRVTNAWQKYGSTYYYLGADGAVVSNTWVDYQGKHYYMRADGTAFANGWLNYAGEYYYFGADGALVVNDIVQYKGTYYYVGADGRVVTNGWIEYQGVRYYVGEDGQVKASGWVEYQGAYYYLDANGRPKTNSWVVYQGNYYYVDGAGQAVSGWKQIDGVWRYFGTDGKLVRNDIVKSDGKIYYMDANGRLASGWHKADGLWYHFDETTYTADMSKWIQVNGTWYYIGTSGGVVTNGWATSNGKWYYMGADGKSVGGWLQLGGKWYYFDPTTHAAVDGTVTIDGKTYTFVDGVLQTGGSGSGSGSGSEDYKSQYTESYTPRSTGYVWHLSDNGLYYYEVNSSGATTGAWQWVEPIMGTSKTTVDAMVNAYAKRGVTYPSSVYSSKGASTIREFCQILYEEAAVEGVRAEVLFAQVMWETAWLQFGGDVKPAQCNFGGIGATGGGVAGNTFSSVREGLRAQVQHLKAYGSTASLVNACVDPRFSYVTRGIIPYVQGLGIPDDPSGYGWAGGRLYGAQLVNLMRVYLGV